MVADEFDLPLARTRGKVLAPAKKVVAIDALSR
jgi:hypothetical protein